VRELATLMAAAMFAVTGFCVFNNMNTAKVTATLMAIAMQPKIHTLCVVLTLLSARALLLLSLLLLLLLPLALLLLFELFIPSVFGPSPIAGAGVPKAVGLDSCNDTRRDEGISSGRGVAAC